MSRIKFLKEEIAAKRSEIEEIKKTLEKEQRMRSEDEKTKMVEIRDAIKAMDEELAELLEDEQRNIGNTGNPKPEDLMNEGRNKPEPKPGKNEHLKTEEARNVNTFKLIKAQMSNNPFKVQEARQLLADGGHYDDLLNGEQRSFDTLVDENGGVLLPTSVSSQIMDMMQEFGVVAATSLNIGNIDNPTKIPEVLTTPTFYAVQEGGAISGSGFNFGGLLLDPKKWGCILPWTNEVSESVATTLMPIIMSKTSEGYANAQDSAAFKGDGSSTYNNIKGLEGLAAATAAYVRYSTASNGNNSFAEISASDLANAILNVAPSARSGAMWVFHPNMLVYLRKLQDGNGTYIYGSPSDAMPVGSLWGYPVRFSEAVSFTDGASAVYGYFYNPRFMAYATGRTLGAERLREGTITDENSQSVNLATTDRQALRFTGRFDFQLSQVVKAVGGTNYGAFTVLRTAAS